MQNSKNMNDLQNFVLFPKLTGKNKIILKFKNIFFLFKIFLFYLKYLRSILFVNNEFLPYHKLYTRYGCGMH